ncbi:MAG: hypothetical protein RLZZ206_3178 [Cyanobacteriota bacterium]|jgi:hypothetical protein
MRLYTDTEFMTHEQELQRVLATWLTSVAVIGIAKVNNLAREATSHIFLDIQAVI